MSVSYIISAIVLASIVASVIFVFIGKIEHKGRKINLNWLILMLAISLGCILTMVLIYHGQNDLTLEDTKEAYDNGFEAGVASEHHTMPSNDEMEAWFSATQDVVIGTNGTDYAVHIIDGNGEEWVLYADEVEK